jgi:hypothetical protein
VACFLFGKARKPWMMDKIHIREVSLRTALMEAGHITLPGGSNPLELVSDLKIILYIGLDGVLVHHANLAGRAPADGNKPCL